MAQNMLKIQLKYMLKTPTNQIGKIEGKLGCIAHSSHSCLVKIFKIQSEENL